MDNLTVPKKSTDITTKEAAELLAKASAEFSNQGFLNAQRAYIALSKCNDILQPEYDVSNRSVKDHLWTVIQQVRNSMETLSQVHPKLAKKEV